MSDFKIVQHGKNYFVYESKEGMPRADFFGASAKEDAELFVDAVNLGTATYLHNFLIVILTLSIFLFIRITLYGGI